MKTKSKAQIVRAFTIVILFAVASAPQPASARFGGSGGGGVSRGGFGGGRAGGGGFRGFGGDGFGGGSFNHSSFSNSSFNHSSSSNSSRDHQSGGWQSSSNSNKGQAYNTYHSNQMEEQQARYNEANTLQKNQETTEKQMHNSTMSTINSNVGNTNWNGGGGGGGGYYGPYGGCCNGGGGSEAGVALGAAALGEVSGMAVGSAISNENKPATTTVVENYPPYGYQPPSYSPPALGTTVYSLPQRAIATTINGRTYFTENGVYYKPFYSGSQVIYIVSQP